MMRPNIEYSPERLTRILTHGTIAQAQIRAMNQETDQAKLILERAEAALNRQVGDLRKGLTEPDPALVATVDRARIAYESLAAERARIAEILVPRLQLALECRQFALSNGIPVTGGPSTLPFDNGAASHASR